MPNGLENIIKKFDSYDYYLNGKIARDIEENRKGQFVLSFKNESGEELSAGDKAACRVDRKEDKNKHSRDGHDSLFLFSESVGEEVGESDRVVCAYAVTA